MHEVQARHVTIEHEIQPNQDNELNVTISKNDLDAVPNGSSDNLLQTVKIREKSSGDEVVLGFFVSKDPEGRVSCEVRPVGESEGWEIS